MVTPGTRIPPGSNIMRVGSDGMDTRNGYIPLFPVIQIIWSKFDFNAAIRFINSRGPGQRVTLCWHDREDKVKPGKKKKFVSILVNGEHWTTYRVNATDRELFERLSSKWNLWFLRCCEQGGREYSLTVFTKTGVVFPGDLKNALEKAAATHDFLTVRGNLADAYIKASDYAESITPGVEYSFNQQDVAIPLMNIPVVMEELGGKLPWKPEEVRDERKVSRDMHDDIVDTYLGLLEACNRVRRGLGTTTVAMTSGGEDELQDDQRNYVKHVWHLLRQARIFEIPPRTYADLYHAVDVYVTEKICNLEWIPPGGRTPTKEETYALIEGTLKGGKEVPFPDNVPFDVCWLAFGGTKIQLTELQKETRRLRVEQECYTTGMLVSSKGEVVEIIVVDMGKNKLPGIAAVPHRTPEKGWQLPNSLSPWIAAWLIRAINSHQHTVVTQYRHDKHKTARKFKRAAKKIGEKRPAPPMFYTVYMKDQVVHRLAEVSATGDKKAGASREHNGFSHRWDRRGSYCYRICRGELPMPQDLEFLLRRRGYTIFKAGPLDRWAKNILKKKGVEPKLDTEWMAIKEWWRRATICGPEDKPYRPSTRRGTVGIFAVEDEGAGKPH